MSFTQVTDGGVVSTEDQESIGLVYFDIQIFKISNSHFVCLSHQEAVKYMQKAEHNIIQKYKWHAHESHTNQSG